MTFIYVLTTNGNNYLEEQAYLSQYSLKYFNFDVKIYTLTDQDTFEYLNRKQDCLLKKTSELIKVDCPLEFTMKQRSRYLKLKMREAVSGDFVYIDSDTIICGDLSELFKTDASVAQVNDLHIPYTQNSFLQNNTLPKIKKADLSFTPENYFNGGVIFAKDDEKAHTFFQQALRTWEKYETKDFCVDQVAFNYANHQMGYFIKELDGIYNCQVTENGLKYLAQAKIIHYFKTTNNSTFLLAHESVLEKIRKEQNVSPDIEKMVVNAKNQFSDNAIVLSDVNRIAVYNSYLFAVSLSLYKKLHILFTAINKLISFFYR